MGFIGLYLTVGPSLPEVESIRKIRLQTPMSVYSSDNQLIDEFGDNRRIPITLDQVPKDFINALLSTEDQRFYEHSGVDVIGVIRAFINLAVTGKKSQGASTITMLVARNYYLTREKRFSRKITEMFLAWKIESELNKNEILELFLNKIPFGHRAAGIGAAAQVYYGTTLDKLSLAKLAVLAGIPKGQSIYNPISYPEKSRARRQHVLGRMLAEEHITQKQFKIASEEEIKTTKHGARITVRAPYLAEMARLEVIKKYGKETAYNDGLVIYTTLNSQNQKYAQQALIDGLEEYDRRHGYRGAEQHYELSEDITDEQMLEWLADIPVIAQLQPAIVKVADESTAEILLKNGTYVSLKLEDVSWAREYVDENNRRSKIKSVSQVLKSGDIIRVKQRAQKAAESSDNKSNQPDSPPSAVEIRFKLAQIPDVSAGLIALKPETGAIEVLVGGYDFTLNQFNMVTQARRQLGSNIKPFIYSAAFNKQYTPASIINDMPIIEADITAENFWRPKNDGDNYLGPTSLRTALRRSKNTVSVRLIREIGPKYAKQYLESLGFPGNYMQPYLSLALGSASMTPLEVVAGYAILANGGYKVSPWFIDRIEDASGRIIFQNQVIKVCRECEKILKSQKEEKRVNLQSVVTNNAETSENKTVTDTDNSKFKNMPELPVREELIASRVIDARNHYLVTDILKEVIHRGTAAPTLIRTKSPLLRRNDLAGKTGTTNDAKDAWFSGFNPNNVATAWVGFSDHTKKLGVREFGGKAALPIWQKYMEKVLKGQSQVNFPRPEGIVTVRIDPENGKLATATTRNPKFELFRKENVPTEYSKTPVDDIFNLDNDTIKDDGIF